MANIDYKELVRLAFEARKTSYSPYSSFSVGAALLGKSGKVYLGGNIENASFGVTNCAERTALFKAVSEGEREFVAIAVVGGKHGATELELCAPCGICRQALREFCDPKDFEIILATSLEDIKVFKFEQMLPLSFGPERVLC